MPNTPAISNLWDTAPRRGFDYLSTYKSYVSFGAEGFYPSDPISGVFGALTTKGDLATPMWFNEFVAGGGANPGARPAPPTHEAEAAGGVELCLCLRRFAQVR